MLPASGSSTSSGKLTSMPPSASTSRANPAASVVAKCAISTPARLATASRARIAAIAASCPMKPFDPSESVQMRFEGMDTTVALPSGAFTRTSIRISAKSSAYPGQRTRRTACSTGRRRSRGDERLGNRRHPARPCGCSPNPGKRRRPRRRHRDGRRPPARRATTMLRDGNIEGRRCERARAARGGNSPRRFRPCRSGDARSRSRPADMRGASPGRGSRHGRAWSSSPNGAVCVLPFAS